MTMLMAVNRAHSSFLESMRSCERDGGRVLRGQAHSLRHWQYHNGTTIIIKSYLVRKIEAGYRCVVESLL